MIAAKAHAVIKRDVLSALRYRNGLLFAAFGPAAQIVTFYYLARAIGPQFRPEGLSYFTFLLVGAGFYMFLVSGMHSFLRAIQESQQTGTLEVLMTTSTPPAVLLLLSALSSFGTGVAQLILYIAGALIFLAPQIHGTIVGAALTLIVFVLSVAIAIAVGMFAAGLQVWMQKGSAALWLFGSSAWVLSGTMFPVGALPAPVRAISNLLPVTHALTAMRVAVLEGPSPVLQREIDVLLLFTLLLVPLSIAFFSWTVRRARQCGTLSFY